MARVFPSSLKVEIYSFHPLVLILTPLLALVLQSYLPLYLNFVNLLDLPLLVVIYFGLTRRSPIEGLFTGALVGMAQDSLSRGPIGLLGSAKTVIGCVTSYASIRFTVENRAVRGLTIFVLYYLHFLVVYLISALLLAQPIGLTWNRVYAALVNTGVGVLLFELLDRFRRPA